MRLLGILLGMALSLPAATFYFTVTGLGGEADYTQRFHLLARNAESNLKRTSSAQVTTLEVATREQLRARLAEVARLAKPDDALVLLLIGHGTFDGQEYKFNLSGPDITAAELAALLDRIPATRQLVVNTTSSSGASVAALRRPGRVVIAATRTGTEKNATVFARYFVEALGDEAADTDKNQVISALEAFRYAQRKTNESFESQKRLATEHSVLEDTGKGDAVKDPSAENGEGKSAAAFTLVRLGLDTAATRDPAKRALVERRDEIEQAIDKLKFEKASYPEAEYKKRLAALLLNLARTEAELER
jgi:hypothetical protein